MKGMQGQLNNPVITGTDIMGVECWNLDSGGYKHHFPKGGLPKKFWNVPISPNEHWLEGFYGIGCLLLGLL